jgi:hypothetical protein
VSAVGVSSVAGVTGRSMNPPGLFSVIRDPQTWRNLLYLTIEFPLATFAFVFAVTLMSVGFSLAWTFVGLLLLAGGFVACRSLVRLESALIEGLTGYEMPHTSVTPAPGRGFWRGMWSVLKEGESWLSLVVAVVRFPIAVTAFSLAVSLVAGSIWLILQPVLAPLLAWAGAPQEWGAWRIDTVQEGFVFLPVGVAFLFLSFHAVNAITGLMVKSARLTTGRIGQLRMRSQVLGLLSGGRVLDGASLLRELRLYNGFSVDLNPTKVYATLLGLRLGGLAESRESEGSEWFYLTPQGEAVASEQTGLAAR